MDELVTLLTTLTRVIGASIAEVNGNFVKSCLSGMMGRRIGGTACSQLF